MTYSQVFEILKFKADQNV